MQIQERQPIATKVQIIQKRAINHDCYIYKLKFIGKTFNLKIGQHFKIIQTIKTIDYSQGQQVSRKYTPISPCSQQNTIDVLFKIYRSNQNINFPNGGKLTPYIQSLNIGDQIHIQGPFGRFNYEPKGTIVIDGQKFQMKKIFFIAGGSGITPCFQTIKEIAKMENQTIQMILLFANKSEKDIVLRQQLDTLQNRVKIYYILDKADQNWKGFIGYITQQILNQICPLNENQTMYIHCGPAPMNNLVRKIFTQKYPQSKIFKY